MKNEDKYLESMHRFGRIASIISILFMLGIPLLLAAIYNIWPDLGTVAKASIGLLSLFIPINISEVVSFGPILGSASYLSFITGNLINLKLPCAINAMQLSKAEQGSEKGDVVSAIAISASSLVTMVIVALGAFLLVPLKPLFDNPNVQIATKYMLPALFGGMFVPMLLDNTVGEHKVKNRLLPIVLPAIAILFINKYHRNLAGYEGILMLISIPIIILTARILYKQGIIKMESMNKSK